MSLTLKIKESRLSADGRFFLRAARSQSVDNMLALRQDDEGYINVDLGANGEKPTIRVVDDRPWTIPEELIDSYRAFEIGPVKLINQAGRALRRCEVVWRRWSIPEWIADFGGQFGVSSPGYVRQMCQERFIGIGGRRKPYQAKLPAPFRGVQDGGRWFITV